MDIDYSSIPESSRQSLLASAYRMALKLFEDPAVQAEYEEWLAKRNAAKAAKEGGVTA